MYARRLIRNFLLCANNAIVYSEYMSTGLCGDHCQGSYAFAIVQGNNCWCSSYIPADQDNTYSCNQDCPGISSEWCGNTDAGLYGYFGLPGGKPIGTSGGGGSSHPSSTAAASVSTSSRTRTHSSSPFFFFPSSSFSGSSSTPLVTMVSSQSFVVESSSYYSPPSRSSTFSSAPSSIQVCLMYLFTYSTFLW